MAIAAAGVTSEAAAAAASGAIAFTGTCKKYHEDKGWGHIACDATQAIYGKDIFFMRSSIRGAKIAAGNVVQFNISMTDRGPQAAEVRNIEPFAEHIDEDTTGKVYVGTVKRYSEERAWGFVDCDLTYRIFGKDVFLHKRDLGGDIALSNGDVIQFSIGLGKDGRPEARDVSVVTSAATVASGVSLGIASLSAHVGVSSAPAEIPAYLIPQESYVGKIFVGVIKEYDQDKSHGWIICDETRQIFGNDVLVHKVDCTNSDLKADEAVQFNVSVGADGRPEAKCVVRCAGRELQRSDVSPEVLQTLSNYYQAAWLQADPGAASAYAAHAAAAAASYGSATAGACATSNGSSVAAAAAAAASAAYSAAAAHSALYAAHGAATASSSGAPGSAPEAYGALGAAWAQTAPQLAPATAPALPGLPGLPGLPAPQALPAAQTLQAVPVPQVMPAAASALQAMPAQQVLPASAPLAPHASPTQEALPALPVAQGLPASPVMPTPQATAAPQEMAAAPNMLTAETFPAPHVLPQAVPSLGPGAMTAPAAPQAMSVSQATPATQAMPSLVPSTALPEALPAGVPGLPALQSAACDYGPLGVAVPSAGHGAAARSLPY